MIPLSILDLSVVTTGTRPAAALRNSIDLAREADALGYVRYWLAEHHNLASVASPAPDLMIGQIAAVTKNIRVGSGGVMLPNHAPLVVAERFKMLEALFPGRIDLGLGRAPGTDRRTMMALRRPGTSDDLLELLNELYGFFNGFAPGDAYEGIHAVPGYGSMPAVWLLGSSGYSAQVAGLMGLPFAFAHHFSAANTLPALELYRARFQESPVLEAPYAQVTVFVVCADTDAEAELWASAMALVFAQRGSGRPPTALPTLADVEAHEWTDEERAFAEGYLRSQVVGSPATVRAKLEQLLAETGADEVMATATIPDAQARVRSFSLLAELAELPTA